MKSFLLFFTLLTLLFGCGSSSLVKPDRTLEEGLYVITNPFHPVKGSGIFEGSDSETQWINDSSGKRLVYRDYYDGKIYAVLFDGSGWTLFRLETAININ